MDVDEQKLHGKEDDVEGKEKEVEEEKMGVVEKTSGDGEDDDKEEDKKKEEEVGEVVGEGEVDDRDEAMEKEHNEDEDGEREGHIMLRVNGKAIVHAKTSRVVELREEEGGDGEQRHGSHGKMREDAGQEDGEGSSDGAQFANTTSDGRRRTRPTP